MAAGEGAMVGPGLSTGADFANYGLGAGAGGLGAGADMLAEGFGGGVDPLTGAPSGAAPWGVNPTPVTAPAPALPDFGSAPSAPSTGFNMLDPSTYPAPGAPTGLNDVLTNTFGQSVSGPGGWDAIINGTAGTTALGDIAAGAGVGAGVGTVATAGAPGLLDQIKNWFTNPSGAPPGAQSALQKILGGDNSSASWLALAAAVAPGALQALGSDKKQAELKAISDQFRTDRSGALARFNSLLAGGPQGYYAGEGAGALQSVLSKINAQAGGIAGSPSAQKFATDWAAGNYTNALTGAGALAFGDSALQANLQSNAANAGQGLYTGLADILGRATTPQDDLSSLLTKLKGMGVNLGAGYNPLG
jgi:hypothetical protein